MYIVHMYMYIIMYMYIMYMYMYNIIYISNTNKLTGCLKSPLLTWIILGQLGWTTLEDILGCQLHTVPTTLAPFTIQDAAATRPQAHLAHSSVRCRSSCPERFQFHHPAAVKKINHCDFLCSGISQEWTTGMIVGRFLKKEVITSHPGPYGMSPPVIPNLIGLV